jgi:murein DD-endopeptidase MepM/ murein hydrolase activator NlpD
VRRVQQRVGVWHKHAHSGRADEARAGLLHLATPEQHPWPSAQATAPTAQRAPRAAFGPAQADWLKRRASGLVLHGLISLLLTSALLNGDGQAWQMAVAPEQAAVLQQSADLRHTTRLLSAPLQLPVLESELSQPQPPLGLRAGLAQGDRVHVVAAGDTLGQIAERYSVPLATLFWANRFDRGDALVIGRELRVPSTAGVFHVVAPQETVEAISQRYAVVPEAVWYFEANRLQPAQQPVVGQELFVPGASPPYPEPITALLGGEEGIARLPAVEGAVLRADRTNLRNGPGTRYDRVARLNAGQYLELRGRYDEWVQVYTIERGEAWVLGELLAPLAVPFDQLPEIVDVPPPPPIWVWPANGSITSRFGARWGGFHNGIDIANAAWTPIVAARDGQVVEAGWCSGYGYCVKIAHDEGLITEYGHLIEQPSVAAGDVIEAGQLIGSMGSTYDRAGGGFSSGVHLHFTVKINGRAINPLTVLP